MSHAASISHAPFSGHQTYTADPTWVDAGLAELIRQHPLIETRPSLRALRAAAPRPPAATFVGIGVASGDAVSRALPLDTAGLLLAAEDVRQACGAREVVVLLADAHALAHGAPLDAVQRRTDAYARSIRRMAERFGLRSLRLLRASTLCQDGRYQRVLATVERRAPAGTDPYVTREVADIAHLDATLGGIVKVGWALQASTAGAQRDERMFDERFRSWVGRRVTFVYAKAGRALDDGRPKAAPYLEREPARRLCITPDENVREKLRSAEGRVSRSTFRGVRNHLSAIARTYAKRVRPLRGTLEARVQRIVDELATLESEGARPSIQPEA